VELDVREVRHRIGGDRVGDPTRARENPADPERIVALSAAGGEAEVGAAVGAAAAAQPAWAARPAPERGAVLEAAARILAEEADEAARDLVAEEGKTLAEATAEVARAVGILRYFGGEGWRADGETLPSAVPRTLVYTTREPIGVVGVITPWNFPIAIPAWKTAPALMAGNAVVLKPAELTPISADRLADALERVGLPPGVLNVVHGDGATAGAALVADARVAGVTFTGSVAVGERIQAIAAARGARVQLEMGGKNAVVVRRGADLAEAANLVAQSAFALTGQACTAASRLIAPAGLQDELASRLGEAGARYKPGDGLADGVLMGPVVSKSQLERDLDFVSGASADGAEVASGGGRRGAGYFLEPTVVAGVALDSAIAREEVFGPVLSLIEANDLDEAIDAVNSVPYGLVAGIVTPDLREAHEFARRAQAGVVKVNRPTLGLDTGVPFGGVKRSSTGAFRELSRSAADFSTSVKTVYVGH
jgi:aldehyde dehydrogenase (NAD+)